MRKAFRATLEFVVDFEEPSVEEIQQRLERVRPGFNSKVFIRELQAIEAPADFPPFKDYEVRCYSCDQKAPRSTSDAWCPSPEVPTQFTCKACRDTCDWSEATPNCKSKTCMIHSTTARNEAYRKREREARGKSV